MTVTTNEHGQQNMFAKEPPMEIIEVNETHESKHLKENMSCCFSMALFGGDCQRQRRAWA